MKSSEACGIDGAIREYLATGVKTRLLLHVCCAPCLCGVVDKIKDAFDVTLFYYNPNIMPEAEWEKRLDAIKRLVGEYDGCKNFKLIVPDFGQELYFAEVKGLESAPEGGARCVKCIDLRLEGTARYLKVNADVYDCFATTLTVSPHKNAPLINADGARIAEEYGVEYLSSDFKKEDGFLRSVQLSKRLGVYRQTYCGCTFK